MNADYTPTTQRVKDCAISEGKWLAYSPESFDRWLAQTLAAHDAEVAATALREAAQDWGDHMSEFDGYAEHYLNARAAALAPEVAATARCGSIWDCAAPSEYEGIHVCALPGEHGGPHVEAVHGWRWHSEVAALLPTSEQTIHSFIIEDWQRIAVAKDEANAAVVTAIDDLADAIRLTVEYVGNDTLPAIQGWSWFDALKKYRPELVVPFVENPIRFPTSEEKN